MTAADRISATFDDIRKQGERPVWITLADRDKCIQKAREAQGPLAGLRLAVKDNIDAAGLPTTAGCPSFAYVPQTSAPVVARLEEAGAIVIGKTNLDQFATGLVGVRSPYGACSSVFDARYISGGSSSGSAVAVAKDWADFSLGTDTAGSGRVPAAFNSLFGCKPTRGLLSARGVVPACRTLDCVSIFARDAATTQRAFNAARGYDAADAYSRTGLAASPWASGKFRFGIPPPQQLEFFGDNAAAQLFQQAVEHALRIGGEPVTIDFTPFKEAASLLYSGPWVAERLAAIGDFYKTNPTDAHPVVRKIIEGATRFSAVEQFKAEYRLAELRRAAAERWNGMDVLLLPTTGAIYTIAEVEADPIQLNTNLGYYTNFVNLLDLAAMAVPAGFRPNGLPFGVTLMAPAFHDEGLLALASRWENQATAEYPGCIQVAVVGAHLTGQPLNHQLTQRGARLVRTCRTSPEYRLYSLQNTHPPKPGLLREPGFSGPGIEIEIWAVPEDRFGSFVAEIPPPLGIGSVVTDSGHAVKCFICEPHALKGAEEITRHGGWRKWRAAVSP